jgi:hypothetical protein
LEKGKFNDKQKAFYDSLVNSINGLSVNEAESVIYEILNEIKGFATIQFTSLSD